MAVHWALTPEWASAREKAGHAPTATEMIGYRMRWDRYAPMPFQHMSVFTSSVKVFVFVVRDNTAVTIEDDPELFPSDMLITQLRLLLA